MKKTIKIPKKFQGLLWSVDVGQLDLEKDKWYIIHLILIHGSFKELKWLYKTYSKKEVIRVFLETPCKNYPACTFNFVKNFLLGLKNKFIDKEDYVVSRNKSIEPQTPAWFQYA